MEAADRPVRLWHGQENGDQLYRLNSQVKYETLSPVWDETFVIPGISGDCLVSASASELLAIVSVHFADGGTEARRPG